MESNKVRIGVIGIGWIGSHYARIVLEHPDAELVAVMNPHEDRVRRFMLQENVSFRYYDNVESLFKQDDIDAVIIASPNHVHADQTVAAAVAGKHIFCDKPMAINLDDCKRIVKAVGEAGVKYQIGYHRRFNPLYQYAKELIAGGRFGEVFCIESDYLHQMTSGSDIYNWIGKERIGGSVFHAGSGHNVDLLRFFGGDIKEVSCFKDIFVHKGHVETEDTAIAVYRFENGTIGKVHFCVGPVLPFTFNFRLYGTKATLMNNKLWLDSEPMPNRREIGRQDCIVLPESWIPDSVLGGIGEPWDKCIDHFIDAVVNDKPTGNGVEDAFRTSEVCFATILAAQEKRVVTLPL